MFDPNAAASKDSGIFGLPMGQDQASLIYLPIPWEATTSYGGGTSQGPAAIFEASRQVDLFDLEVSKPYEAGLYMLPLNTQVKDWNTEAKKLAQQIIEVGGETGDDPKLKKALQKVNQLGDQLNQWVFEQTLKIYGQDKIPALVGGDHSVPFGAFQATAQKHGDFGILHFDAHSDTRRAYEGFTWSHASIMFNALDQISQIKKLVQVGIRDFCEEEIEFCQSQGPRCKIHFDSDLARKKFEGRTWSETVKLIIDELPQKVWVSFDIDGLDPRFCPNTGTPVPGGLDFNEACYILRTLAKSGRKIIGFDLNEVAPDPNEQSEWDANVGSRLLYKMTAWTLFSQGKAQLNPGF